MVTRGGSCVKGGLGNEVLHMCTGKSVKEMTGENTGRKLRCSSVLENKENICFKNLRQGITSGCYNHEVKQDIS